MSHQLSHTLLMCDGEAQLLLRSPFLPPYSALNPLILSLLFLHPAFFLVKWWSKEENGMDRLNISKGTLPVVVCLKGRLTANLQDLTTFPGSPQTD